MQGQATGKWEGETGPGQGGKGSIGEGQDDGMSGDGEKARERVSNAGRAAKTVSTELPQGPLPTPPRGVLPTSRLKAIPLMLGCLWAIATPRAGCRRRRNRRRLDAAHCEAPGPAQGQESEAAMRLEAPGVRGWEPARLTTAPT